MTFKDSELEVLLYRRVSVARKIDFISKQLRNQNSSKNSHFPKKYKFALNSNRNKSSKSAPIRNLTEKNSSIMDNPFHNIIKHISYNNNKNKQPYIFQKGYSRKTKCSKRTKKDERMTNAIFPLLLGEKKKEKYQMQRDKKFFF